MQGILNKLRRPRRKAVGLHGATQKAGRNAEDLAARHIKRHGGRILDRNWRCPQGELDLVVLEKNTLVFVEVKSLASDEFGRPIERVDRRKRRRIERLALQYCRARRVEPETMRFDVVEILGTEAPQVTWTRGAWLAGE